MHKCNCLALCDIHMMSEDKNDKNKNRKISTYLEYFFFEVMAHCPHRGDEMLIGDRSHISIYEQGSASQVQSNLINHSVFWVPCGGRHRKPKVMVQTV